MPVHNAEIAALFDRLADLLEIEDANPFRVRAYRNAARTVGSYSRSMADLVCSGEDLSRLPGIGKDLALKIGTIVRTGKLPLLEEVEARTPAVLSELMRIEGLGPKRVKMLYKALGIRGTADLKAAAEEGRIRQLPGFGAKVEQKIAAGLAHLTGEPLRMRLIDAEDVARPLVAYLGRTRGVKEITIAGSYRRRRETVGDLDILVTARKGSAVMERFVGYEEVDEILSHGTTRSAVRLRSGLHVDLRLVPQISYGAALYYFTGSKAHNIAVRRIAVRNKLKLNEYGVFRGNERVAGRTEKQVFASVGLPCIAPELREDRGEIEAARAHKLPRLVKLEDVRGDLHCHTSASDGRDTLEDMARAARERGYEYVSINDHSQRVTIAHGLDRKRLFAQMRAIDKLNRKLGDIVVLKSVEVDILEDGSLDLPDEVLKELDFTVCAVHSGFHLPREKQTRRILRAMDNPHFNILAHPTGRLINERKPYEVDLQQVMVAAVERGCCLEVNGQPSRLDLDDDACLAARELGVRISIGTDAHATDQLEFMRFAVYQARRGWLSAADVINTRPLGELQKLLSRH